MRRRYGRWRERLSGLHRLATAALALEDPLLFRDVLFESCGRLTARRLAMRATKVVEHGFALAFGRSSRRAAGRPTARLALVGTRRRTLRLRAL